MDLGHHVSHLQPKHNEPNVDNRTCCNATCITEVISATPFKSMLNT